MKFFNIVDIIYYLNSFASIMFYAALIGTIGSIILFFISKKTKKKKLSRTVKKLGIIFLIMWVLSISISSFVLYSKLNNKTLKYLDERKVQNIKSGTTLLNTDRKIQGRNYAIDISSNGDDVEFVIWDYAGEDGDMLQILVNDIPKSEPFKLTHTPQKFKIPRKNSDVQIKGFKDGDGNGINYALTLTENDDTYFNGTTKKNYNTYRITKR